MPISRKKRTISKKKSRKTQNKKKSVKKSAKRTMKKSNQKKSVKKSVKTRRLTYNLGFHRIPHENRDLNEICSNEKMFTETFKKYKDICPKLDVLDVTTIPPYIKNGELTIPMDLIEYYTNIFENSKKCVPLREKTNICFRGVESNPLYTREEQDDVKGHNRALNYIKKWIQNNNKQYNSLKSALIAHRTAQIHIEKAKKKKIEKKVEEKKKLGKQKKDFTILMEEDY